MVLTIMVILATIGLPMLRGSLEQQRLKSAADRLRAEWHEARLRAMEDGQIFCLRCQLGGSEMILDRILDAHFTAGLSTRNTTDRFDILGEYDPFEKGNFTGETEDFILRDPSQAKEENGTKFLQLPEAVFVADVVALPEERAVFYLGLTAPGEMEIEENTSEHESVANQEIRLGESSGSDGYVWSTPIFFYPDGTTSAAAVLLKNDRGQCVEVRLRGLTGIRKVSDLTSADRYSGELDSSRERALVNY